MNRLLMIWLATLAALCPADTFINKKTGETINGYVVSRMRGNDIQVRAEGKEPVYINLSQYRIQYNYIGRRSQIHTFSIKEPLELIAETDSLIAQLKEASDRGPYFILIEIDSPGADMELARRLSFAISELYCPTVAYISGGQYNGAFGETAIIALSCDKVYMKPLTSIGALPDYLATLVKMKKKEYPEPQILEWQLYVSELAKKKNRPELLARAMIEKDVQVIQVEDKEGKRLLIAPEAKTKEQKLIDTWASKDKLLRLMAVEAEKYGIADERTNTTADIYMSLKAQDAKIIPDRKTAKSRQAVIQTRKKLEAMLEPIKTLEKRSAELVERVDFWENEIKQANRIIGEEGYGKLGIGEYTSPYSRVDLIKFNEAMRQRDLALDELLGVLRDLANRYNRAIELIRNYPDLADRQAKLEGSLTSAQQTIEQIQGRKRYRY
ncbi:MAG: hypothetical protein PHF37_09340 [Phycisphaerae bacterium]|nr:hypothetical protein [Phycisphaerae bacterium]